MTSEPILTVSGLTLRFAGMTAVDDVGFTVNAGEIFALIGPNGAGKTSVLNCISGVYLPSAGRVVFDGENITARRPHRIAAAGLVRTFQNVEVFPTMSVIENLMLGRHHHLRAGVVSSALWWGRARNEEARNRERIEEVIEFLEIQSIRNRRVGDLPHGLQKRVELGRALAMEPKLLMLDEPVAGMNQEETEDMVRFILDVNEALGLTVILIEHDMGVVMNVSSRVAVLEVGRLIALDKPAAVASDPRVIEAYLGSAATQ